MVDFKKAAKKVAEGVGFGDLGFYSSGFQLPEGDYAMEHEVRVHAYTKQDGSRGQEMLGVLLKAYPLAGGDPVEQFLSMGRKAMLSFMPDAETGKKLVAIPGGPSGSLAGMTNWNLYLKSLYDCGLPAGLFTNDISVLDGIWVHTQNVPEPEGRKSLGAQTGEVAQEAQRGPQMTLVVTEIKDDGKPWENGGGVPEVEAEAPAPKAVVKPGPKAMVKPVVAKSVTKKAAPVVEEPAGDEETLTVATEAAQVLLEKNPNGMLRLGFRTTLFSAVKKTHGDEMADAVISTFLEDEEQLNGLVGQFGYSVQGNKIAPA